jgi:putative MATE family efflux protein
MGSANLIPLILTMSAPSICGNLSGALYNIISRVYLGRFVGSAAMGAMGVIFPLNNLLAAIAVMITIGGAAIVSMALGSGDKKRADAAFTNIMFIGTAASTVLAIVYFLFPEQLVAICGASAGDAVFLPAVQYLKISAFGMVFQMINQAAASVIRAEGNTLYSMVVSISGNVMNVALGAVFIIWLKLGVRGAALATLFSQFFSMVMSIMYFTKKKSLVRWGGAKVISPKQVLIIMSTGVAPAIFQGLSFVTNILINNSLKQYAVNLPGGFDLAVSAVAVIAAIENVALMFIMGMNNGISSIISYNYGARNYRRVMKASITGQILASAAAIIVWLLMMFAPNVLFRIFVSGKDTATLEYGAYAIHKCKLFMFFLGFQTLASMFYSAIGKPKWATVVSISRNGLFLVPALLILPKLWGLDGVLYSSSVSDACSAVVVGVLYAVGIMDLRRKIREQEAERLPVAADAETA